jgi:hypothetical protein
MNPKPKGRDSSIKDESRSREKKKLCKPLSLSQFTFDEIVETALATKPKKKAKNEAGEREED